MKKLFEKTQLSISSQSQAIGRNALRLLAVTMILVMVSCSEPEQATQELKIDPGLGQAVFAQPADAATAFAVALETEDSEMISELFGADYKEVLSLEEVDTEDVNNYLKAWNLANKLIPDGEDKLLIAIGEAEWTFPVPIAEGDTGWYFDIVEGREGMAIRRIGRNELATMQAVLAYYDAQMEYAEQDQNGNGMLEYAQRFISTEGTRDGLYWDAEDDETVSPLGPLMADLTPGGGYHGYHYKILKEQGAAAKGGAYNYVIGDKMRAGFALIAWPVEYGESGVMSFIVSHSGIVYQNNLGPDGADIAMAMTSYNPDEGWEPVKEVNGP
ncbi:MAG: DUF2950 domain-containing protein [Xanthomonadales bacterium]|nr:DUF2950 domain-containing protein [Xanthomonadales bacterium]